MKHAHNLIGDERLLFDGGKHRRRLHNTTRALQANIQYIFMYFIIYLCIGRERGSIRWDDAMRHEILFCVFFSVLCCFGILNIRLKGESGTSEGTATRWFIDAWMAGRKRGDCESVIREMSELQLFGWIEVSSLIIDFQIELQGFEMEIYFVQ